MIQTNANIVPGDSGGPLTSSSQVIGMDTAANSVSSGEQQQSAAGFAIPINTALSVARQIAGGKASSTVMIGYPPFVGILIGSSTSSSPQAQAQAQQEQNGFGDGTGGFGGYNGYGGGSGSTPRCYTSNTGLTVPNTIAPASSGTLIDGVICGSPAATAGITAGSVITSVNGQQAGLAVPPDRHPGPLPPRRHGLGDLDEPVRAPVDQQGAPDRLPAPVAATGSGSAVRTARPAARARSAADVAPPKT